MKILGAARAPLQKYLLSEFGFIVAVASLCGSLLSLAVSAILVWQLFDGGFSVDWAWVAGSFLLVTALGIAVALRAAAGIVAEKPLKLLRQ